MKNYLVEWWNTLKNFLNSAIEDSAEASIFTTMWTDGYSAHEIDQAIADYRKTVEPDKNEI